MLGGPGALDPTLRRRIRADSDVAAAVGASSSSQRADGGGSGWTVYVTMAPFPLTSTAGPTTRRPDERRRRVSGRPRRTRRRLTAGRLLTAGPAGDSERDQPPEVG